MSAPVVTTLGRHVIPMTVYFEICEIARETINAGLNRTCGSLWERIAEGKTR